MKILSVIFVLAIGSVCFAELNMSSKLNQGSFWATFYASKLGKSDSFDSLLKNLSLSKKDHELALEDGSRMKAEFILPEVNVSGSTLSLKFPEKTLSVDFGAFGEGKLKLNGNSVVLDSNKTFLNYRSEVFLIISRKQASNFLLDAFVPSANAKGRPTTERHMANYVATLFVSSSYAFSSMPRDSSVRVADWIIQMYVSEAKLTQRINSWQDTPDHLPDQYSFTCKNGQLEALTLMGDGGEVFRKTSSGWEYEFFGKKIQTDDSFTIIKLSEGWSEEDLRILEVGTKLLPKRDGYLFGYAPLHFNQCCRDELCVKKVNAAKRAVQKRFQADPKGKRSVQ